MSKIKLQKYLANFSKEEIIEIILNLYDARAEAKDYLEFFLNPNEQKRMDKVKSIIYKEFFKTRGYPRTRITVCRKAIKDFISLGASHEAQAEVIFFYFDLVIQYLQENHFIKPTHIKALEIYLNDAQNIITTYRLQDRYAQRARKNLEYLNKSFPAFHELLAPVCEEIITN